MSVICSIFKFRLYACVRVLVTSAATCIAMRSIFTCYASHLFHIWEYC
jgi:hypothetical protein